MPKVTFHTYGKTRVRLLQVLREHDKHEIVEVDVTVLLEGDLAESFTAGDNSRVLPTDTIKNTIYVLARQRPIKSIEDFVIYLGHHFLNRLDHVRAVRVEIDQTPWARIAEHAGAFVQSAKERRITRVSIERESMRIISGLRNLQILKTSKSAFAGYLKDEFTTLPETQDRLLGTVLDGDWTFAPGTNDLDFNHMHCAIRAMLLDVFAQHQSLSVQHTLYAMAEQVLKAFDPIEEIHLTMPNKHCLLFDLARFGLENPNQVFVPTDEPSGLIEARVSR